MKKRVLCLMLAVILCVGIALPAWASGEAAAEPAPAAEEPLTGEPAPAADGDRLTFSTADELEEAIRDFENSGAKSRGIKYDGDGTLVIDRTIELVPWLSVDFGKADVTVGDGCTLQVHHKASLDGTMTVYGDLRLLENGALTVNEGATLTIEGYMGVHEGTLTVRGAFVNNGECYVESFKGSKLIFEGGSFSGTGELGARGSGETPREDYIVKVPLVDMALSVYENGKDAWEIGYRPIDRSHEFRSMDELEELLRGDVPNDIDYVGEDPFVIDRDVTIPAAVHFFNAENIEIAKGVTLTAEGYFGIGEATLTIFGTISGHANIGVGMKYDETTGEQLHGAVILAEGGVFDSLGCIYFHDTDTTLTELVRGGWLKGFEGIDLAERVERWDSGPSTILQLADGPVFRTAEELEAIIDAYNAAGKTRERCTFQGGGPLVFERDIDFPAGLTISFEGAADVTVSSLAPSVAAYFVAHDVSFALRDDGAPASAALLDEESSWYRFRAQSVAAGNTLLLECAWALKEAPAEDTALAVTLPGRASLQEGTVAVDGAPVDYSFEDGVLTVPVSAQSGTLTFSVRLLSGNTLQSTAELRSGGASQQIGAISTANGLLTVFAPNTVSDSQVAVSGHAPAGSEVRFWVNGEEKGTARASAIGLYSAQLDIGWHENGEELALTASAETADGQTLTADASVVFNKACRLPGVTEFRMYYYEHELMKEIDLLALNGRCPAIYYDPSQPFTFVVSLENNELIARYAKVFVVSTKDGVSRRMQAFWDPSRMRFVANGFFSDDPNYVPGVLSIVLEYDRLGRYYITGWDGPDGDFDDDIIIIYPPLDWLIDPSGYVYEAVERNRLEGVTATLYYQDPATGEAVYWDPWEYGQDNPLVTDAAGYYAWDVPEGLWQVRYEKDGYETAYSDWMEVPPMRTDVNVGLVSTAAPAVEFAALYEDGALLGFTQYMDVSSVNEKTVGITADGRGLAFTVTPWGESDGLAKTFRLTTDETLSGTAALTVSGARNYADRAMEGSFETEETVGVELKMVAEKAVEVVCGEPVRILVRAEPAAAAAGRTVTARLDNPYVAAPSEAQITFDESGVAALDLTAALPGTVRITFTPENGADAAWSTLTVVQYTGGAPAKEETVPDAAAFLAEGKAPDAADLLRRLVGLA